MTGLKSFIPMSSTVRESLRESTVCVVKVGSSVLTGTTGYAAKQMDSICSQVSQLVGQGRSVIIVSSGAVAEGCQRMGFHDRPHDLHTLQAAAAVGQIHLTGAYQQRFQTTGIDTALVLLTHDDLSDRNRYLNARATLETLIRFGVVTVINENDSVATDEIRFGDNDTLAARVCSLVGADVLVVLTDQSGLHESDPRLQPDAPLIGETSAANPKLESMAGASTGSLGRGGMKTKLQAAAHAAQAGCHTVIADGRRPNVLVSIFSGEDVGTLLTADLSPVVARKRWIAGQVTVKGSICLDHGAEHAVRNSGVSVLAVGVVAVSGRFSRGDVVSITNQDGKEIGKGLINYSSDETSRLSGHSSGEIEDVLGYVDDEELIHRDNLALTS